jgi:uncharacterized protein (TIGR02328 family)
VLPELQLRSQWRECVAIAKDLHETGFTHHLLINQIMNYSKDDFNAYCYLVYCAMVKRGFAPTEKSIMKLHEYTGFIPQESKNKVKNLYADWHNKEYLRICFANLFEKYKYGIGTSKISEYDWENLCARYEQITGEKYQI